MHISTARLLITSLLASVVAAAPHVPKTSKFLTVEGGKFKLGGKDFHFAGSNAYYFPFNGVCGIFPLIVPSYL